MIRARRKPPITISGFCTGEPPIGPMPHHLAEILAAGKVRWDRRRGFPTGERITGQARPNFRMLPALSLGATMGLCALAGAITAFTLGSLEFLP